jgi:hypothetical protein
VITGAERHELPLPCHELCFEHAHDSQSTGVFFAPITHAAAARLEGVASRAAREYLGFRMFGDSVLECGRSELARLCALLSIP